ncbi:MAG: hypothetical protein JWR39_2044, partial [Devosia sp.]|nr:hypothetical protein [Devosia sp.]
MQEGAGPSKQCTEGTSMDAKLKRSGD